MSRRHETQMGNTQALPTLEAKPPDATTGPIMPPVVMRNAYDLRENGQKWEVVKVRYGGGAGQEEVVFSSEAGAISAEHFFRLTIAMSTKARTGVDL